jgi:hypothetical protein
MTKNVNKSADPSDNFEQHLEDMLEEAALNFSDVQVRAVMDVMFELLRERFNFVLKHTNALQRCRKVPDRYPSDATLKSWINQVETKQHQRFRDLIYDGIDFEDERVKEAFDVGCRLLRAFDEAVTGPLQDIIDQVEKG